MCVKIWWRISNYNNQCVNSPMVWNVAVCDSFLHYVILWSQSRYEKVWIKQSPLLYTGRTMCAGVCSCRGYKKCWKLPIKIASTMRKIFPEGLLRTKYKTPWFIVWRIIMGFECHFVLPSWRHFICLRRRINGSR